MVAIKLALKCAHCDYEDLEMSMREGEEGMVVCPYCRGTAPLSVLQDSAEQQAKKFREEGLPGVQIPKNRIFG